MANSGFELIGQTTSANGSGEFQLCSDDIVLFSGTSDQLTFMRGGADTIVAIGTNQTIESGLCEGNAIYLLGRHTNLEFYEGSSGTTTVYGGMLNGATVTLMAGEAATESPYRGATNSWGTQVTIHAGTASGGVLAVADFAYDPHVAIVPA